MRAVFSLLAFFLKENMDHFDHIFWNLFLKTIFKFKNKKQFKKISFSKHGQMNPKSFIG